MNPLSFGHFLNTEGDSNSHDHGEAGGWFHFDETQAGSLPLDLFSVFILLITLELIEVEFVFRAQIVRQDRFSRVRLSQQ